jgi:hypothetical protein
LEARAEALRAGLESLHKATLEFWTEHGEECSGGPVCDNVSIALNEAGRILFAAADAQAAARTWCCEGERLSKLYPNPDRGPVVHAPDCAAAPRCTPGCPYNWSEKHERYSLQHAPDCPRAKP